MKELYLALKALDSETFQRLIFQLLKARYPDVLIQQIDGRGGDQGLDIISGQLAEQPTVWECKSFPDGVKKSQQEQITKSLKRTLENFTPKRWVLCLSVDMRTETCKWFQILVKSHAADTAIELYGASEIIGHLIHFDSIREHFFPNTVLNTRAILEQLAGTNEFTDDELGKLNEANVKSYVERLQSRDHRFTYQITFGRDRPPTPEVPIGSLLNIAQDGTAINVFPRDIEALRVCPPQITLMPKGAGVEKFLDNCRSGRPQTFTAEELFIKSDLDFLLPREGHWEEFSVGPTASTKTNPFRITFGKGESAVLYEYVQFREVRRGTEERLFESVTGFPLQMFLLIRPSGTCDFRFEKPAITQPVTHFMKLGRALSAMNRDGSIEFYDLESSESFSGSIVPGSVPAFHCFAKFVNDLASINEAYSLNLTYPSAVTEEDHRTIEFLQQLQTGVKLQVENLTANLVKAHQVKDGEIPVFDGERHTRIILPQFPEVITLFGTEVSTGTIHCDIPRGRFQEPQAIQDFLKSAPMGQKFNAVLDIMGPVTFIKPAINQPTNS